MKYLSLFSGIGGFEYGMMESGVDFECIGFSEVDKYAKSIYKKHFPRHRDLGDATKLRTEELGEFDLLVGGFPCQAFSMAGYRKGFDDTRGTLFFEISRVLKDKRPRYFLLENVKGLLSHDKGKTFQTILEVLSDLGYDVEWRVLNSKNHGVPPNRERVYIKGHLRGESGGQVLSDGVSGKETVGKVNYLKKGRQGDRVLSTNGINQTLTATGGNSGRNTFICNSKILNVGNLSVSGHSSGNVVHENGVSPTLMACNYKSSIIVSREKVISLNNAKQGQRIYSDDGVSCTLCGNGGGQGGKTGLYLVGERDMGCRSQIRRLTPLECERLQGFPDNWTQYGADDESISDTQRYKCCGNAVTTNVVRDIMKEWFGNAS